MTQATKERIQFLLIRYLEGKASPEERQLLSQYLADEREDDVWMELMEELMATEEPMTEYDPAEWQSFVEGLRRKNAGVGRPKVVMFRKWAVAAAVLLVLAGGAWWWMKSDSSVRKAQARQEQGIADLQPGSNRAILTLSGGRQIVLDSAANGVLTQEGNTQVQKLSNGRLEYSATSDKRPATSNKPQAASDRVKAASDKRQAASEVVYNTLSTPKGGQYQLTLPDGTKVWLNAASSITYPTAFTNTDRTVKITGEAYFEVAHHARRPFRVQTYGQLIEDIGTAFNVNSYEDEPWLKTTLVEGAVKVSKGAGFRLLSPGQQARSRAQGDIDVIAHADVQQALAWKNGAFSFRDADLATVMRQLARWYDIDVEYEGAVPAGTFDGEIGRGLTLRQVLEGLAQTRIHYNIINNHKIIITK
ncbi:FecR domain-containing protein [Flavitalea sp. BT771]|uniref:FecR family protein n=1 Tax=Flavitalea sp. BT771 TaxID=3063329 RepID=UPI0026E3ECF7|nr:FecR family protein [Flavitalea sp. BT771]MDO6433152.1 FecR domain-containing protein [Flavitalea sp. BT771]MDV6221572.1 FecR domain-containing protein [Flavitalea sp. BT771]